jgi:hypothetical protein
MADDHHLATAIADTWSRADSFCSYRRSLLALTAGDWGGPGRPGDTTIVDGNQYPNWIGATPLVQGERPSQAPESNGADRSLTKGRRAGTVQSRTVVRHNC